ncbi:MAG: hypothetical protein HOK98_13310 [Rhodospirillaceae bacterium]|nr:hypothetical protein [Rhodospirillaceae bacterium]MBT6404377.1 hypothetical protein [Rhodospirillaceae bacterium]MBT6537154.1 hypothetical protein [Rhodospirillaceae bacterium]MBT7361585.1 hypothetical protein [Rhodospirillaceae bacterium]
MTDELDRLIALAKSVQMTPDQQEEQRRSFAYGNAGFENELITKKMVDEQAEKLKSTDD